MKILASLGKSRALRICARDLLDEGDKPIVDLELDSGEAHATTPSSQNAAFIAQCRSGCMTSG